MNLPQLYVGIMMLTNSNEELSIEVIGLRDYEYCRLHIQAYGILSHGTGVRPGMVIYIITDAAELVLRHKNIRTLVTLRVMGRVGG